MDVFEKYFVDRSNRRDRGEPPIDLGPEGAYVGPDESIPDPTWRYRWLVDSTKNVIPTDFENW